MKEPIEIKDFCDYRFLSELKLSSDGNNALFVVSQANMENNHYQHNIYCYDFQRKTTHRLTTSNQERSFLFEDNQTILFAADRDNACKKAKEEGKILSSFWRLPLYGGEAQKAFSIPLVVNSLWLLGENQALVTALTDLNRIEIEGLEKEALIQAKEQIEDNKDYEVIDELPYWFNGRGFVNKQRRQLFLVELDTGNTTLLTSDFLDVQNVALSEDKQTVVVAGALYDSVNDQFTSLFSIDLKTKKVTTLLKGGELAIRNLALINSTVVFTATDYKTYGTSENTKFYKMDLNKKKMECFLDQDLSIGSTVGSDAKLYGGQSFFAAAGKIYTTLTTDNCSNIYAISLDGVVEQITSKEGCVDCFDVKNERIAYIGMRDLKLQEMYEVNKNKEIQATEINTALVDKEVRPLIKLSFVNDDGVRIDGWVIEPRGYDPKKKYPAILDIHGGPKTVYGEVFFHEMQVWASLGYFVFFCNPRGSDGRGNEFMNLVKKYGTVDVDDLMNFTDLVLKQYPAIDDQKVAVTGGSYGGFMVNWLIGHTHRFCCAASQRSIANWVSKSLTTDIGYYHNMSQMAATPWSNIDQMWHFSPLKYADQCTTPTLFIHSNEDYRCWMAEAMQMFQALKLHGCETRLCLFKGENHELSRAGKPKHRRRRLNEITMWFEKYCR